MADQDNNSNNVRQHQDSGARLNDATPLDLNTQSSSSSRPMMSTAQPALPSSQQNAGITTFVINEPLPVKRKRGRPRKVTTDQPPAKSLSEPPVKRGPGRPRKETTAPPPESSMEPPVERDRGRPRKVSLAAATTTRAETEAVAAAIPELSVPEATEATEATEAAVTTWEAAVSEAASAPDVGPSVVPPVKRGRGRPPGSKNNKKSAGYSALFVSSTDDESGNDSTTSASRSNYNYEGDVLQPPAPVKRGRGRPPGSKNKMKSTSYDVQFPSNTDDKGDDRTMTLAFQANYNSEGNAFYPPPPVKRRPGRPPGSKNKNKLFSVDTPPLNNSTSEGSVADSTISSFHLDSNDDDGSAFQPPPPVKRGRGRPPGSKNKNKLFSLDAPSFNSSTSQGSVADSMISSLHLDNDDDDSSIAQLHLPVNRERPPVSGNDDGSSSSWNLYQGHSIAHPVKRHPSRGPSGKSTLSHSNIPLVIPNINPADSDDESSASGGGPLFASASNISQTSSFRRSPSPNSTYTRSLLNFYNYNGDDNNTMEMESDTDSQFAQHGDRPPRRRRTKSTAHFRLDTPVDGDDSDDRYTYSGSPGDDDNYDDDHDTEDDSDASNPASQASAQFSTLSQYRRRPIQLGDRPPRAHTASPSPSIAESSTLFDDYDRATDDGLDDLVSHGTTEIGKTEPPGNAEWIDRSLHQHAERQQKQHKRHTLKRRTKRKKKEREEQQWDRDARVARLMMKHLPKDDVDTTAIAQSYRQQVQTERRQMHQQALARHHTEQQKQEALIDSGGLVWKTPLVSKPYTKRPKLRNKLTPTDFRKVSKVRDTVVCMFIATLKEHGIAEPTEDHKRIMQDFYDDIEANLPCLEGERRLFSKALRWLTQDTQLANALRLSATRAKRILESLVWDMNLASECDLSMADDEWVGLAALQKQIQEGHGSAEVFLAKHSTPGNKATAKEIDRYVLQLKKYPTSSIIQYKT